MGDELKHDNHSDAVRFLTAAKEYFRFVDSFQNGRPDNLWPNLLDLLTRLAYARSNLKYPRPDLELSDDSFDECDFPGDIQQRIRATTKEVAKPEIADAEKIGDPDQEEIKNGILMLFDDVADIYGDVWKGVRIFESGESNASDEAAFHWLDTFSFHWGEHLHRAMMTDYQLASNYNLSDVSSIDRKSH